MTTVRGAVGSHNPSALGFDSLAAEFDAALWTGEMLVAAGHRVDPFPPELDKLAVIFFSLFRPTAQA